MPILSGKGVCVAPPVTDDWTWASRLVVALLVPPHRLLTKTVWIGGSHIPRTGGVVVAINHTSQFATPDAYFVVGAGRRIPRYLAKSQIFNTPALGRIFTNARQIPVHRGSSAAGQSLPEAVDAVQAGDCVVVYPEGTVTRDPDLWPMRGKTGAARIALASGCEVIPVAGWGLHEVMAPYVKELRLLPRKTITHRAGPPVDLDDLRGREPSREVLEEATNLIMDAITGLLEETRGETAPPIRFDPKQHGVSERGGSFRKSGRGRLARAKAAVARRRQDRRRSRSEPS